MLRALDMRFAAINERIEPMRNLIVYYSLSGITRKVAENAALEIGADLVEVRAKRYRPGVIGFLRAGYDSWRGHLPPIEASGDSPERYDFVLLMSPVWAGHAATPIRAYAAKNRGRFKRVAFALTCGGWCPARAFDELKDLVKTKPEAALAITETEVRNGKFRPASLSHFLELFNLKKAA
jgi:flavodoxin